MSEQGGLFGAYDPLQKPLPPVQSSATSASLMQNLLPITAVPSSELGESWSPFSERTDGNTIFGGHSSNDCWSGSMEFKNSHPKFLRDDYEMEAYMNVLLSSVHSPFTMEAADWSNTNAKGKKVGDDAFQIDANTKPPLLSKKLEIFNGGKLIIPNQRLEKLINECSEKSTNSPTFKTDGEEIVSSATDGTEIPFEEIADLLAYDNEKVSQLPKIGMEFASEEGAYKFYENYAKECGFKIRRGKVEWSSDDRMKKRILLCSREGYRSKKSSALKVKYARKETRTGCNARIKIIAQNGKWVISDLCLQHSHGQEASTQMHNNGESSTHVSKLKSLSQFVTRAETLEPRAAYSDKFNSDVLPGNINGLQEKEKEDALSFSSATTKMPLDCSNITQNPGRSLRNFLENDEDVASKPSRCQSVLKDLENSSSQVMYKLCMGNIASSSKEIQASSINIDDESMENFYTNLDLKSQPADQNQSELEICKAIELLRGLFKDKLSVVIHSKYLSALKSPLSFLSSFTKQGDLSVALKSVFFKLAGAIPSIIDRYNRTNTIIDQTDTVKAAKDTISCELTENKRKYLELSSTRMAINCEIAQTEEMAIFYQQQLNELKAKCEKKMEVRDEVLKKMKSNYVEGTGLKRKADELEKKAIAMELQKVCAEQTRVELEHEWDELGKLLEQNLGT